MFKRVVMVGIADVEKCFVEVEVGGEARTVLCPWLIPAAEPFSADVCSFTVLKRACPFVEPASFSREHELLCEASKRALASHVFGVMKAVQEPYDHSYESPENPTIISGLFRKRLDAKEKEGPIDYSEAAATIRLPSVPRIKEPRGYPEEDTHS